MATSPMILSQPLDQTVHRILAVSDLHIGNPKSRYGEAWAAVREAVQSGGIDQVIINGDFTDRQPYAEEDSSGHNAQLEGMLEGLLAADPHLRVTVLLGNHDKAAAYQQMLQAVQSRHHGRFAVGDALLLGKDTIFTHGDFGDRTPLSPSAIRDEEKKSLERFKTMGSSGRHDGIKRMIEQLDAALGAAAVDRNHVFFGHIHPKQLALSESMQGRDIHLTGAAMEYCPGYVLQATFEDGRLAGLSPIFEETREAGRWTRISAHPRETARQASF